MLAADIGRAALLATIPIAYAFDALTFAQLYVVGFLTGTLSVLFWVSYNTLFVSIVPRERYVEASSLLNGSRALSFVGGPSLAGILVQVLTAPVTLVLDAVSFLVSAFSLSRIAPEEPPAATRGGRPRHRRACATSPARRSSAPSSRATATINLFNFMFFAIVLLYANRVLHVGPGLLGLVLGVASIGGVLGSLVTGRITRWIGVGPAFAVGCVVFPAPLVLVPLAGGPRWVVLGCLFLAEFLSGFGVMLLDISAGGDQLGSRPRTTSLAGVGRLHGRQLRRQAARLDRSPAVSAAGSGCGRRSGSPRSAPIAGFLWLLPSPIMRLRELPEPDA